MGKSLLIVDDSASMRKIILRTIRRSGMEFDRTEEAGSGTEALQKLGCGWVDVMLCDVYMPEMSGAELVKRVREVSACDQMRIVMVSTESAQSVIDQFMADGVDGYITKPFTPEKFQEQLTPLIN